MDIIYSAKAYKTPQIKVVEVKAQGVLCQSTGTEKFTVGNNSYEENDWE